MKQVVDDVVAAFSTRPVNVLTNVGNIFGLLLAVGATLSWDTLAIPIVYLCLLSLFLIVRYLRQERWARYAEGLQVMDKAHRRLKEITDRHIFGSSTEQEALASLQESLATFSEAFTLVTGTACRATIKELYWEDVPVLATRGGAVEIDKELWVATVTRSDIDASRLVSQESPDRVSENSDFEYAVTSRKPFYGANLPKLWLKREYTNSHWPDTLRASRDFPYRSAIVWPIEVDRPSTARQGQAQDGDDDVVALLCIDSQRKHAFRRRADVPFGSLYAHALYPVLYFDRETNP